MMKLLLSKAQLAEIAALCEQAYPEEAAGFLLGEMQEEDRAVLRILASENTWEGEERARRYLLGPLEVQRAEQEADALGMQLIGVFHSHPDHPAQPSDFDRQWALPWFSYLITSVNAGESKESRAWRLRNDRGSFQEEELVIIDSEIKSEKE